MQEAFTTVADELGLEYKSMYSKEGEKEAWKVEATEVDVLYKISTRLEEQEHECVLCPMPEGDHSIVVLFDSYTAPETSKEEFEVFLSDPTTEFNSDAVSVSDDGEIVISVREDESVTEQFPSFFTFLSRGVVHKIEKDADGEYQVRMHRARPSGTFREFRFSKLLGPDGIYINCPECGARMKSKQVGYVCEECFSLYHQTGIFTGADALDPFEEVRDVVHANFTEEPDLADGVEDKLHEIPSERPSVVHLRTVTNEELDDEFELRVLFTEKYPPVRVYDSEINTMEANDVGSCHFTGDESETLCTFVAMQDVDGQFFDQGVRTYVSDEVVDYLQAQLEKTDLN